jgi:CheY-like chemotaxis protein
MTKSLNVQRTFIRKACNLIETQRIPYVPARPAGVLVVDDEPAVRRLLESYLKLHGFVVWTASHGIEAVLVYRLNQKRIDIALLDVLMPGMDGPETMRALKAHDPRLCCCLMSGDTGQYTVDKLKQLGSSAFFAKPFDPKAIMEELRRLTQTAGSVRDRRLPG